MQRSPRPGIDIVPDFNLWDEVRKTAVPIHQRKAKPVVGKPKRDVHSPPLTAKATLRDSAPGSRRAEPAPTPRYDLTGLDRRTSQKLTRGKLAVDAKIDLHGLGIEEARHRLMAFLIAARSDGHRTVLVITGKGASPFGSSTLHGRTHFDSPERQGRLRRLLPQCLADVDFRRFVTGFQPAHPRHGGGGAFYVRLRRLSRQHS